MKYNFRFLFISVLVAPLLVQCVPTGQDITNLDLRVRNLDNKVVKMHQEVQEVSRNASKNKVIEELQGKQAEMNNVLERLNMEFLQIKGQLDENSHFYQNSKNSNKELESSLDKRINDLADQIMLLVEQMNSTSQEIEQVKKESEESKIMLDAAEKKAAAVEASAAAAIEAAERKAAQAQAQAEQARKTAAAKPKIPTIEPDQLKNRYKDGKKTVTEVPSTKVDNGDAAVGKGPGNETYNQALGLFRAGKYNQAYRAFTNYIEQNPKGRRVPNARFWLGDCYYNQQEYELAILEYQKVIADFAKHPKAPAALLKQGLAFEKLHDNATAVIVYRKLMEDYPKSEQFGAAKKRIKELQ